MLVTVSPALRPWHHLTLGLTLATAHMLYHLGWCMDDPHITFRYIENWISGNGLAFNAGEPPLEGYSNFLWLLLLIPWAVVAGTQNLMSGAQILGFICGLAVGPLLAWTWQRTGPPAKDAAPLWRWLPLYLWGLSGPAIFWAVGGLETPLVALLITGVLFAVGDGWHRTPGKGAGLGALLVLLAMARPEGLMYGTALCGLGIVITRERGAVRSWLCVAGAFAAGLILFQIWRVATFGSLVPNSVLAKMGNPPVETLVRGLRYFASVSAMTAGLPLLAWVGLWAWPRSPAIRVAVVFAALQLLFVVCVGGDWMPGARFLVPALPCLILLLTAGVRRAWDALTALTPRRPLRDLLILALMIWVAATLFFERNATREIIYLLRAGELTRPVQDAVDFIESNAGTDDTLAGEEAGILPFVTGRRFLDLLALNDRHLAAQPGGLNEKMDVDHVVNQWKPDWVLLIFNNEEAPPAPMTFAAKILAGSDDFALNYTEVHRIPREWGKREVRIFHRVDSDAKEESALTMPPTLALP
jgi:hypothetical protein